MPSQPNANSPFLASRLEAELGVRSPGTPSIAGQPGVQAGGFNFPAPPSPATGIPGRPPGPTAPTPGAGMPQAPTPQAKPGAKPAGATKPTAPGAAGAGAPPANQGNGLQPPVAPPLGVPDAEGGLALTPEGDMRYRQAVLAGRDALGPIPRLFRHASLPEMPFELGQANYNPFTGAWSEAAPTDLPE